MLENRNLKIFLFLLLIVFPLRESFALMIGENTPMRFGELLMAMSPLLYFVFNEEYVESDNTISNLLLIFLAYSFIVGIGFAEYIQPMFAIKYFIRGILLFVLIRIAEDKYICISEEYFVLLFKYTVIIEAVFCLIQMFGYTILYGEFGPYEASETFGFKRLSGTASEPGYLIPIITPCIYYFISDLKKYSFWAILSFAIAILSLSTFGYVAILVVLLLKLFMLQRYSIIKSFFALGAVGVGALITAFFLFPQVKDVYEGISTKIIAFSSFDEEEMDYSGAERAENLIVATDAFLEGGWNRMLFGQGVGATAYHTENNVEVYKPAEEANNLYLSVLLNQGLIGFVLLLLMFFSVFRQAQKTTSSMALLVGFITQLLQYFIVGNLWLYFFWFYIFFIIIINRQQGVEECPVEEIIEELE
jgi:O-antigen ligase